MAGFVDSSRRLRRRDDQRPQIWRARRTCPHTLWAVARRKLMQLNRVRDIHELAIPPGNRLEQLVGERAGQYSIRINEQYRVCFSWENGYAGKVQITG